MKCLAFAVALVAAAGGTAAAQSRKAAERVHDFHTMDRQTPMTTFGFDLGYEVWDDAAFDIVSLDVAGHYVSGSGAGAYVLIPLSYVSTDDITFGPFVIEGETEVSPGNIELGGLYTGRLGKNADMLFHGGIALPTADDDGAGGILGPLASFTHFNDIVSRWPNSTWLRAGISPMGRMNIFFWRFDVGVDLMLDDEDGDAADISPVIRVNAGGGVDLGSADVTAELVTNIVDPESDAADDTGTTLALGARFKSGNVQPGACLILPIGLDDYDDFQFALAFSLTTRVP